MPVLSTREVHFLECQELDRFVTELFDRPYNSLNAGNTDGIYSQNEVINFRTDESWLDEGQAKNAVSAWLRMPVPSDGTAWQQEQAYLEGAPDVREMMEYLGDNNHILQGEYAIQMWW